MADNHTQVLEQLRSTIKGFHFEDAEVDANYQRDAAQFDTIYQGIRLVMDHLGVAGNEDDAMLMFNLGLEVGLLVAGHDHETASNVVIDMMSDDADIIHNRE